MNAITKWESANILSLPSMVLTDCISPFGSLISDDNQLVLHYHTLIFNACGRNYELVAWWTL